MIIEVKKLNALGKYTGNFDFGYVPPEDICIIPLCKVEGEVKVAGSYEIFEDDYGKICVEVTLKISYLLKGQCSYCLEDAQKQIEQETTVLFVPEQSDDDYYYDGNKINLKTAVDDAILMSQPQILLCKEDCKGIDVT